MDNHGGLPSLSSGEAWLLRTLLYSHKPLRLRDITLIVPVALVLIGIFVAAIGWIPQEYLHLVWLVILIGHIIATTSQRRILEGLVIKLHRGLSSDCLGPTPEIDEEKPKEG